MALALCGELFHPFRQRPGPGHRATHPDPHEEYLYKTRGLVSNLTG